MKIKKIKITDFAIYTYIGLLSLIFLYRMFHGIDFYDEPYYFTGALQILRGQIPLVDIQSVHVFSQMLIIPLLWIYELITGGFEGIILFMRISYFIFNVIILICSVKIMRKNSFFNDIVFYIMLPCIFYSSYSIVSLSYNSMSNTLNIFGIVLLVQAILSMQNKLYFAAGIVFGLSTICYPTLMVYDLLLIILLTIYLKYYSVQKNTEGVLNLFLGGFVTLIIFLCLLFFIVGSFSDIFVGVNALLTSMNSSYKETITISNSLLRYVIKYSSLVVVMILSALTIAALMFINRKVIKKKMSLFFTVSFILISIVFVFIIMLKPTSFYLIYYMVIFFLSILIIIFVPNKNLKRMLVLIQILNVLYLVIRLFSTANNSVFAQFVYVSPFVIVLLTSIYLLDNNKKHLILCSLTISSIMVFSYFMYVNEISVAGKPINQQVNRIEFGIYKGISIDNNNYERLMKIQSFLSQFDLKKEKILILDTFSALYGIADGIPYTLDTYSSLYGIKENGEKLLEFYEENDEYPTIIIIGYARDALKYDVNIENDFNNFILNNYKKIGESIDEIDGDSFYLGLYQLN
ncbi:MAG: hypothetical protein RR623_08610 [Bacilli bacterium]